jgi:hypothetical protein
MSRNRVREAASLRIEISGLRQYAAEPTRPGDIVVLYVRSSATTSSVHLLHPSRAARQPNDLAARHQWEQ